MILLPFVGLAMVQIDDPVLSRAHSHNDYTRAHPLSDALENRFVSVEADIFLIDGKLLVGHDRVDLKPERTLESLYLEPLTSHLKANRGAVYSGRKETFWVLVDIKTEGVSTYNAFKSSLDKYPLLSYKDSTSPVRFVISGNRPVEAIVKDQGKFAGLDGRWSDLSSDYSAELMPWVSEAWSSHFAWKIGEVFTAAMQEKLLSMTEKVHLQKRKLRFWGAPDNSETWNIQWKAGVDWINTDNLPNLRNWMLTQDKKVR